ncbi:MAG: HEAT repeat domain-containing protein [Snowella sp.]|nr:HEAT repeat domain-containing protein [Snowella sp.]
MIERLSDSLNSVPIDNLLQQSLEALSEENWGWINYLWSGMLEEPATITTLNLTQRETLLQIALSLLAQGDFEARWDLSKWLPKLGSEAIAPLLALLADDTRYSELRWFVVKMLGAFNCPDVILGLANLLHTTDDPDLKAIASQSLASFGNSTIQVLARLLTSTETRLVAVKALALMPEPAVINPLLSVLQDPNAQMRAIAVAALGRFKETRIIPVLIQALQDLAAIVRKEAIIALGSQVQIIDADDYLSYLTPLLQDIDLDVCQQAAIALSRLPTPGAATVLFEVLKSPLTPSPLKITLIQALGWLAQTESLSYLGQALFFEEWEIRLEIIRVLGRVEEANLKIQAVQILINFFASGQPDLDRISLRQALAHSFGQLKLPTAIPVLQSLSLDPEKAVKLQAIAALKKCQPREN